MESWTKLKYRSDERSPQAIFFNSICNSRTQINNEILNEIEIQKLRKPVPGEIFDIYHSKTQIINGIVNEIEIQERYERPLQAKFFSRICHSRTQIINGIVNEIEIH